MPCMSRFSQRGSYPRKRLSLPEMGHEYQRYDTKVEWNGETDQKPTDPTFGLRKLSAENGLCVRVQEPVPQIGGLLAPEGVPSVGKDGSGQKRSGPAGYRAVSGYCPGAAGRPSWNGSLLGLSVGSGFEHDG